MISNSNLSASKNFIKFNEARLQAVLSRNMYSEHGFDALIRPPSGQVCHSLMVSSYCTPGSAHAHAASPMASHTWLAGIDFITLPLLRATRSQLPSCFSASKNLFGIRTELFEF